MEMEERNVFSMRREFIEPDPDASKGKVSDKGNFTEEVDDVEGF